MLKLTRRQITGYLEKLAEHVSADTKFQADLHGRKLKPAMAKQVFDKKSDEALEKIADERYKKMMQGCYHGEGRSKDQNNGK